MSRVCITKKQRDLHVASETAAVLVGAPFLLYLAAQACLPAWARAGSAVFAVSTLAVDSRLLASYAGQNGPRRRPRARARSAINWGRYTLQR